MALPGTVLPENLPDAPLIPGDAPAGGRAVWVDADDGARLRIGIWPGPRMLLLLPGRTEYIEKYGVVLDNLARAGWGALVIDWRGQGLSSRLAADAALGHVGAFADYQRDLTALLALARGLSDAPMPVIAHSMGGCIAFRALVNGLRPPAVALSAPMLGLAQPAHTRWMIRALAGTARLLRRDGGYVPSTGPEFGLPSMSFAANPLTRDQDQFERMKAQIRAHPALALGGPSLRWTGRALAETAALAAAPSPPVPALIGLGGNERIVSAAAIRTRAARWHEAELVEYPDSEHELLMERPAVRSDFLARALALFAAV